MSAQTPASVTVAQFLANPSAITAKGPVEIADTAANIGAALDMLPSQLGGVSTIEITDNADVAISAGQATADSAAIAKLSDADDFLTPQVQIADGGGAIASNLSAIEALAQAGELASLTVTDDEILSLTTQQANADIAALDLARGASGVPLTLGVADTGAHIAAAFVPSSSFVTSLFESLENDSHARLQVSITDGGAATLIVFPNDTLTVQGALGKAESIDFADAGGDDSVGTLILGSATSVNVSGMSPGEAIVFGGAPTLPRKPTVAVALSLNTTTDVLSVTENGAAVASLQLTANEAQLGFGCSFEGRAIEVYALPTKPTADEYLANTAYYNAQNAPLDIIDTAADVAADLNGLQTEASHIGSIVLADNGTLQLAASQAVNDGAAMALIGNANGIVPVHIAVSDTGADISAQLDALDDVVKTLSAVTVTGDDTVVTMTASQAQNDSALLAALQPQAGGSLSFTIADSGANLSAAMNAIEALETRAPTDLQLEVTDAGAVTLEVAAGGSLTIEGSLGAGQSVAFNGGGALDLDGATDVRVSGFASDDVLVFENLPQQSKGALPTLSLDDATDTLSILENTTSIATVQLTAQEAALPLGSVRLGTSLEIVALPTDPTVDEYLDNAAYYNGLGTRTSIVDTAANVEDEIDALQAASANLASITISDNGVLTLSATQLANDGAALGLTANADDAVRLNIAVSDSAGDISSHLDLIESLAGEISGVTVTGSAADDDAVLSLTAQQAQTDIAALQLMEPPAWGTLTFAVTDTAANLSAAFDAIEQLDGLPRTSLVVTVSDGDALTLTAAQFVADSPALTATQNARGAPLQIDIVDKAGNITDDFPSLAAAGAEIASITISDNAALALTPNELAGDTAAIARLRDADGAAVDLGPYAHAVGVAAFLANLANYSAQAAAAIVDTAANISANFDELAANAADIASLAIADDEALTLSADDFLAHSGLLAVTTDVDGASLRIDIVDTAAHLQGDLDALAGEGQEIGSVTISDGGALTLSANQIGNDASLIANLKTAAGAPAQIILADTAADFLQSIAALGDDTALMSQIEIRDSTTLTLTAAQATDYLGALPPIATAAGKPETVDVSDTSANILANIGALQSISGRLSAIVVDDSLPLTLTAAQAADDAVALALLKNADGAPVAVSISDTTDDIILHLDTLQAHIGEISSIVDASLGGRDDTITVDAAQFQSDGAALARIVSSDATPAAAQIDFLDLGAYIGAHIDALDDDLRNGSLGGLAQSDLDDDIVLTAAQFARDGKAVATLAAGGSKFAVQDSAAGLIQSLPLLASDGSASLIASLSIADDAPLVLSASEFLSSVLSATLQSLQNADAGLLYTVSDTAQTLSADMDNLEKQVSSLSAIEASDNRALTLSAGQIVSDADALALLRNSDDLLPLRIDIADSGAAISSGFSTLASLSVGGANPISAIAVTDGAAVTLSADDLIDESLLVSDIHGARLDISDTAANLQKALPELLTDIGNIGRISITDSDDLVLSSSLQKKYAKVVAELPSGSVTTLPEISWATYQQDLAQGKVPASFAIDDTASNIETKIVALSAGLPGLVYIEVKSGALRFGATTVEDDAATLGAIQTLSGGLATFAVADSATNIVAALNALESLNSQIASISVTPNGALAGLTAADIADDFPVLSKIAAKVDVADAAATLADDFAALGRDSGQIAEIAVSDGGALALSAGDVAAGQATLNALYAGDEQIQFAVQDGGFAIAAALAQLQSNHAHISSITINDGDDAFNVTAAQWADDGDAIALIQRDNQQATFALSDTAADISRNFDKLAGLSTITIADNAPVPLTLAQVSDDSLEIGALVNANGSAAVLEVADTAAKLVAAKASLAELPAGTAVGVDDSASDILADAASLKTISVISAINASGTAAVIAADAPSILAIQPNATTTHSFSATDNAANIAANLDGLARVKGLVSVTVTGGAPVVVDIAQLAADAPVIALLETSNPSGQPLSIKDSYAHAESASGLAALQAAAAHVASVTLTGSAPSAPFTAAQFQTDRAALDLIGAFTKSLAVSGAAADILGVMPALRTDKTVKSVVVVDTAAHIAAELDKLDDALSVSAAASETGIGAIVISDNAPLTLDVAQLGDSLALAKLKNANGKPYVLTIADTDANLASGAGALKTNAAHIGSEMVTTTAAQAQAAESYFSNNKVTNKKLSGVEVVDTAADIESGLAALNTYAGQIGLEATDTAVNVDFADFRTYNALLNGVAGGFDVTDSATDLGSTSTATATALGLLLGDHAHIARLSLTGSLAGVSAATAIADAAVLQDVSGGFSVTDSAATLAIDLGKLGSAADFSELTSIVVSGSPGLILSATAAVADASALSKLSGRFVVNDTGVALASDADKLEAESGKISMLTLSSGVLAVSAAVAARDNSVLSLAGPYEVSDTGANIANDLTSLLAIETDIRSISLTSGAVDVSVATLGADTALLKKIAGGVTVADGASEIATALSALATEVTSKTVAKIDITPPTPGSSAYLETSTTAASTDAAAITAIAGAFVLELTGAGGAVVSQKGRGNGLTLVDSGRGETLTGGGSGATFELEAGFGAAEITDFHNYASGSAHDTIAFARSDFSSFALMTAAAKASSGNIVIAAVDGDTLTLDKLTLAQLKTDTADFKFV